MTLSEFRRLLEIWGSDPQRWPTGDRERAIALLGDSPEARQLNDEARKLDRALDALPLPIDVQASARWLKGAVLARGQARSWRWLPWRSCWVGSFPSQEIPTAARMMSLRC